MTKAKDIIENVDIPNLVPLEDRYFHSGYEIRVWAPEIDNTEIDYTDGKSDCFICGKMVKVATCYWIHRSVAENALPFGARYGATGTDADGYDEDGFGGLGWHAVGTSCKNKVPSDCLYPVGFHKQFGLDDNDNFRI